METIRKPLQGICNIIRFNWHFYLASLLLGSFMIVYSLIIEQQYSKWFLLAGLLIFTGIFISCVVSAYIYDFSGLYSFNWLNDLSGKNIKTAVNIHAGFDETSVILKAKFNYNNLLILDFYDASKQTELSIKRARRLYKSLPETIQTSTDMLPLQANSTEIIFVIFAAHEIRDAKERIIFFKELKRIISPAGHIIVTEHLRDIPNFLAYTIGFFHFYSKKTWLKTFEQAGLSVTTAKKKTPFITTFILQKHGTAS